MKKKLKRIKKLELHNKVKIKSLEKNPQKGGTPAIEKRAIINTFEKKLFAPKSFKEYVVFKSVFKNWKSVEKTKKSDKL